MGLLEGRVAVITGAGGGIGSATAVAMVRQGAKLVLTGRTEAGLAGLEARLGEAGFDLGEHLVCVSDVAVEAEVAEVYRLAEERFGGVDVLYNNAASEGVVGPIEAETEDHFDRLLSVNVKGVWHNVRHALPLMRKRGRGSIVNCGSGLSLVGSPGLASYTATKHAIIGLSKSLARELAPMSIRVNVVCPGPTQTRMLDSLNNQRQTLDPSAPAPPSGPVVAADPEEIAATVTFVASDQASFMTGSVITVDGGFTAGGAPPQRPF